MTSETGIASTTVFLLSGFCKLQMNANNKVKVKVTLQLVVYRQSVCLGSKPLETNDQNFFPPTEPFRY
jgi:hypothetical protein